MCVWLVVLVCLPASVVVGCLNVCLRVSLVIGSCALARTQ